MSDSARLRFGSWVIADPPYQSPKVGQVWYDRDHRVISRYAKVIEIKDDGRIVIRRGREGSGRQSTLGSSASLRKRWLLLEWRPA